MKHARRPGAMVCAAGTCLALVLAGQRPPASAQETGSGKPYVVLEDLAPVEVASAAPAVSPPPTTRPATTPTAAATTRPVPTEKSGQLPVSAAETGNRPASSDANRVPGDPSLREQALELWRQSARPPQGSQRSPDLQRRVEELGALRATTRPAREKTGPVAIPLPERPLAEPPEAASQPAPATRPTLDPAVLEKLKKAPADGPAGAVALADALFRDGHVEPAGAIYESALAANPPADQKDWALFQLANCKLEQDPQAALTLYQRLAKECPDSPWAAAGAAQVRWIEWKQAHIASPTTQRAASTAPKKGT